MSCIRASVLPGEIQNGEGNYSAQNMFSNEYVQL